MFQDSAIISKFWFKQYLKRKYWSFPPIIYLFVTKLIKRAAGVPLDISSVDLELAIFWLVDIFLSIINFFHANIIIVDCRTA